MKKIISWVSEFKPSPHLPVTKYDKLPPWGLIVNQVTISRTWEQDDGVLGAFESGFSVERRYLPILLLCLASVPLTTTHLNSGWAWMAFLTADYVMHREATFLDFHLPLLTLDFFCHFPDLREISPTC